MSWPLMPPMAWLDYRGFTDNDLESVIAHLQTIPPVYNEVLDYILPTEVPNIN